MKFLSQPVNRVVVTDNNGNIVVEIGPGGVIQLFGSQGHIDILADTNGTPTMYFYNVDSTKRGYINLGNHDSAHGDLGINSGLYPSAKYSTHNLMGRLFFQPPGSGTALTNVDGTTQTAIGGGFIYTDSQAQVLVNNASGTNIAQLLIQNQGGVDVNSPLIFMQTGDGTALNGPVFTLTATQMFFQNKANTRTIILDTDGFFKVFNEGWNSITFQNGWSSTDFGFHLMPDSTVQFRGSLAYGTTVDGTLIGVIPAGYRPLVYTEYVCSTTGGATWNKLSVDNSGNLKFFNGNGVPAGGSVIAAGMSYTTT